jgi:hypothetical protein
MESNLGFKEINLQKSDLKVDRGEFIISYNKYRNFILPLIVIAVSIIIIFVVLIPQIQQYFNSRDTLNQETQKLTILKNNYNFLVSVNEDVLDLNLKTLARVLPKEKDFLTIINSVTIASSKVGISISNYKFSLGNLSQSSSLNGSVMPSVQMELNTDGSAVLLNQFVNELYKTAPLVDVYSIKHRNDKAVILLQFFYKPFQPENSSEESPVIQLSVNDQNLIKQISGWNNASEDFASTLSAQENFNATNSGQATYSPF